MKYMRINVDASKLRGVSDAEKERITKDPRELFEIMLNQYLSARFQRGLSGPRNRALARVLQKLDKLEEGSITLELEDAEFDLIKDAFMHDESFIRPEHTRLIAMYVEHAEEAIASDK